MLNQKQLNFFNENGYLVIDCEQIFDKSFISDLKLRCAKSFLNYKDIKSSKKLCVENNFVYDGVSYNRNSKNKNKNKLYGFRATKSGWNFNDALSVFLENTNLMNCAKQILNTNKLSLHTSALIKVYPGCDGEPKKLHVDTSGFVDDTIGFVSKNKFVLNTLVYLNDVTKGLAPMRVCPKSHKDFLKINNHINKKNKTTKFTNNMQAAGIGVDENIAKEFGYKIKNIYGKAGTIIFMSGNLLHSATKNETTESRIHFNFNLSRKKDIEIRKLNYKLMSSNNINFGNFEKNFKDKNMLKRSYSYSSLNRFLNSFFKYKFKLKNKILNIKI